MTVGTQERVAFGEAFRRIWVANPTGTIRNTFAAFGCLFFLALQVVMFVIADNTWALLGVVFLPAAAWLVLRGWVYQRQGMRALGLCCLVLGAMLPFYLM